MGGDSGIRGWYIAQRFPRIFEISALSCRNTNLKPCPAARFTGFCNRYTGDRENLLREKKAKAGVMRKTRAVDTRIHAVAAPSTPSAKATPDSPNAVMRVFFRILAPP
jgi:hypothetical protein